MRVGIMQPYFFPYMGYWQLLKAVDVFIVYDDVNYISRGYINRNYITINNRLQRITLNIQKASINKHINQLRISDNKSDIFKTITHTYKNYPQYQNVIDMLRDIIYYKENNLAEYLTYQIFKISEYLNAGVSIVRSSDLQNDKSLAGQNKIIDICKYQNCTEYINVPGGIKLYDKSVFHKNSIRLTFIKPDTNIPYVSIIDLLMKYDRSYLWDLIQQYTLI